MRDTGASPYLRRGRIIGSPGRARAFVSWLPEAAIRPPFALLAVFLVARAAPCTADDDPFGPAPPAKPPPAAKAKATPDAPTGVDALKPWLAHDDWLCRALAGRELRKRAEDGTVGMLAATLAKEADPRVSVFLLEALFGRPREDLLVEGGAELVDVLVSLLGHPHRLVRERALAAFRPVAPPVLPLDPRAIRGWWDRAREAFAIERREATARRDNAQAEKRALARRGTGGGGEGAGGTHTVASAPLRRYGQIERIRREGLEVMVCLDHTGSMTPVIDEAKASVARLLRRIRSLAPRFRVGLVTYDDDAFLRVPLSADADEIAKAFRRVTASGGGDPAEGVDKAVALASMQRRAGWSGKAVRVIVVVGDAPPHEEDVQPLMRFIDGARADPLYDLPLRIDTISTNLSGDVDFDGYVPYFRAIAARGRGTAIRLRSHADLALEIVASCFGPEWGNAIRELSKELDAFEAAAKEPPSK